MFGCHTAFVLRRLRRLCERGYNSHPSFVVTSATVANPKEHVQELLGKEPPPPLNWVLPSHPCWSMHPFISFCCHVCCSCGVVMRMNLVGGPWLAYTHIQSPASCHVYCAVADSRPVSSLAPPASSTISQSVQGVCCVRAICTTT